MSMSEFDDRQERKNALDQFANPGPESRAVTIPQQAFSVSGDRVVGAQQVAVHRDDAKILTRLSALAAAAGEAWYYRFPVRNRKENRTDWIEGGSIKLANDLARIYGNCDVSVRVVDIGDAWIIYSRFTDLETGFSMERPFQQRKAGSRIGGDDDARRLDIALQIGTSKSIRNVILNALQTLSDFAFEEAKSALVDKVGKDLPKWRGRTTARIAELNVDLKRVERVIGRTADDWLAPDVARVIAMMKSVQDGMASLDETFPPLEAQIEEGHQSKANGGAAALDQFAQGPAQQQQPQVATEIESTQAQPQPQAETATGIESAGPQSGYQLAQQLIIACEKAKSPEAMKDVRKEFGPRIKVLADKEDRLDVSQILTWYEHWRDGQLTEKQLEQNAFDRLELLKKRGQH